MLHRVRVFLAQNPLTPSLAVAMTLLLVVQWSIAATSTALFKFLFVAQPRLTPGLVFSPFAHAGFSHLFINIGLLLLFGWLCEAELSHRKFLGFVVVVAYISTFAQVLVDTVTTGSAATLGFSGVAYAFPPFYAVVRSPRLRDSEPLSQFTRSMWGGAVVVSLLIPFLLVDLFSFGIRSPVGADPAIITHAVGFLAGLLWGVVTRTSISRRFGFSRTPADIEQ